MQLNDKVILVTGGTRGIGRAICEQLATQNATVIFTGTSQSSIDTAKKYFDEKDISIEAIVLDVSNKEMVDNRVKEILEKHNKIDVLINNAGITKDTLVMRMKEQDFDDVININLKGAFNCIQACIKTMSKKRQGKIINISSVVGLTGNIGQANYSAAKAGLIGLSKSCAKEFAVRNICVNAIAPGFIETEMTDKISEQAKQVFLQNIPLQKAGNTSDVANLVNFLASDLSNYITGQTFNVDGGLVMY